MARLRAGLTYSNVMSTIAVVAVLAGGTALAASKIGAKDIRRDAIRARHVKSGQIKTRHIAAGAVTLAKLKQPPAVAFRRVVETSVPPGASAYLNAKCRSGERLVGGGAGWFLASGIPLYQATDRISVSGPGVEAANANTATPVPEGGRPDVWHASGTNQSGINRSFAVYAICAKP